MQRWGRLLRLSLAPSAVADVLAGLVVGSAGAPPDDPRALWLAPASLGVYHGALCLNDWRDREHDARTRPARPLPSGQISARAALALGLACISLGVGCAALASPVSGWWMAGVAILALTYDLIGRGPWTGPILLALCRAGNVGSGVVFALLARGRGIEFAPFLPSLGYGLYVFFVSRLGRLEDGEDQAPLGRRPARLVTLIGASLLGLAVLPPYASADWIDRAPAVLLALLGAAGLARVAWDRAAWTRARVERTMGAALRRLLVCTAVLALGAFTFPAEIGVFRPWPALAALLILAGYPIAFGLRALFPPS